MRLSIFVSGFSFIKVIEILKLIKAREPQQFRAKDEDGSMPIHIVAHGLYCNTRIINFLLEHFPDTAGVLDGRGRLPLHLAAEGDLSKVIERFIDAEPRSLTARCPITGLLPWQLASYGYALETKNSRRINVSNRRDDVVETTFLLLRRAPHLIQSCIVESPLFENEAYKKILRNKLKREQLALENMRLTSEVESVRRDDVPADKVCRIVAKL